MSGLLILKSDRICGVCQRWGGPCSQTGRPSDRKTKGKFFFFFFGGGGGGGGGGAKHLTYNLLLSSADEFWGFTDRYRVGRPSAKCRATVGIPSDDCIVVTGSIYTSADRH